MSGNRNLDLDIPGLRGWQKIKDLDGPALAQPQEEHDFAADPEPPAASRPRPRVRSVDEDRVKAAELLARRDEVSFPVAAARVPTDPRALQKLLHELKSKTTDREE